MFRSKTSQVVSDIILILLSSVIGTFIWNHGSTLSSSKTIMEDFISDLQLHWWAYLVIVVCIVILALILWLRYKHDDTVTKKDIDPIITKLNQISEKLNIPQINNEPPKNKK